MASKRHTPEQISNTIMKLEQEIAEKEAEVEDLQKSKADPKRIATNLQGFARAYEGLDATNRQWLIRLCANPRPVNLRVKYALPRTIEL